MQNEKAKLKNDNKEKERKKKIKKEIKGEEKERNKQLVWAGRGLVSRLKRYAK